MGHSAPKKHPGQIGQVSPAADEWDSPGQYPSNNLLAVRCRESCAHKESVRRDTIDLRNIPPNEERLTQENQ